MIRALWAKSLQEGKWLLIGSAVLLFCFQWIRVWITSQVNTAGVRKLLQYAPEFLKGLIPVPLEAIATPAGRIAVGYDDPLVMVVVSIWAIARGSDMVSGEIGRGTMELLLAQPVRRIYIVLTHAAVTVLGLFVLAISAWLGTFAGIRTFVLEEPVQPQIFLPAALNLFSLGFFLAGVTSMLSAMDRYRSRTIGVVIGFFVIQMIIKLVAVTSPSYHWLRYFSFLTAFEPQRMAYVFWPESLAIDAPAAWQLLFDYNSLLLGIGLLGFALASAIFCQRDLPAPL